VRGPTWHIPDDAGPAPGPASTVSLAFLWATVRRLWFVWLTLMLAGGLLASAWLLVVPARSVGTVTLLLAHDPGAQPETAMATDISLLQTRTVAQELISQLSLDVSVEDLQRSIIAQPTTSSVLQIDIVGTDPGDAVARARALGDGYLAFREEQLLLQNDAVIDGHRQRIETLRAQIDDLTAQYDLITARGGSDEEAADLLTQRAQFLTQVSAQENAIEDASLEVSAVVAASRVLDPASLVPQSPLRRAVLLIGSGLIGGLGLGLGLVLAYAVTTGRLRSRADVAAAMGLPVAFSSGGVARRWLSPSARQRANLELLVDGFLSALPTTETRRHRLALLSVDCHREAAMVLSRAAERLGEDNSVLAVDLTGLGLLSDGAGRAADSSAQPRDGSVTVATDPGDAVADVVLTLVPFDVGRGLAHLKSVAPRCVVLVKAGRSTPEGLRTVSQAGRAAGVDIAFVMLVGTDSSDSSFGAGPVAPSVAEQKEPRAQ
jgi:capsular polysaccharide biosynthesis protein